MFSSVWAEFRTQILYDLANLAFLSRGPTAAEGLLSHAFRIHFRKKHTLSEVACARVGNTPARAQVKVIERTGALTL